MDEPRGYVESSREEVRTIHQPWRSIGAKLRGIERDCRRTGAAHFRGWYLVHPTRVGMRGLAKETFVAYGIVRNGK
jgi:hypothetical protein